MIRFKNIHEQRLFITYNIDDGLYFASQKFNTIVLTHDLEESKNYFFKFQDNLDICDFELKYLHKSVERSQDCIYYETKKDKKLFNFYLLQDLSCENVYLNFVFF